MNQDTVKKIISRFDSEDARYANKALDYMDGKQLTHVVNLLDHPTQGRKDWKGRGMRAAYRNLTGSIVEKSGLLFMDGRPEMFVTNALGESDIDTERLHSYLDKAYFEEFMMNFDSVVRLLKTGIVLTQYDNELDQLYFDVLHRGNCVVETYPGTTTISMLAYRMATGGESSEYRIFAADTIEDWEVPANSEDVIRTNQQDNLYGHVPATVFHDIKSPRAGFWCTPPRDLVMFNEEYNLYMVDTFYAASFANRKTMFTNAAMEDDGDDQSAVNQLFGQSPTPAGGSMGIGPDKIVQLDTMGIDNVFLEYKGPDIQLQEIRELFQNMVRDIAGDWSVRVKLEGEGTANSGFQVVVEEMPNLELRKQRQKSMESGLSRLYQCIAACVNIGNGNTQLDDEAFLDVEFAKPSLPVDMKAEDEMWLQRIKNGLASRVDYFVAMKSLSREEAIAKVAEIDSINTPTVTE